MQTFKFFHGYIYVNVGGDVLLPMMTRMQGRTLMSDLVPVQPMNGPTGQIFYMDFINDNNE